MKDKESYHDLPRLRRGMFVWNVCFRQLSRSADFTWQGAATDNNTHYQ